MRYGEKELCLLVQVETGTALENLEVISSVDGVDGVFIGPSDLSASLGYRGAEGHPVVQAAIERSIKHIRKAGKAAGTMAVDPDMAKKCVSWGASFVAVAVDTMLYTRALDETLALFRNEKHSIPVKKITSC
jgi:2-dehydro-3-deoxy-L-rhamnonate aldolase